MKKLLLTLICILSMFAVKAQCDYTLEMNDSWGDGWNAFGGTNNEVDVFVNGLEVLSNQAAIGSQTIVTFQVNPGDDVYTVWQGGGTGFPGYEEETSYRILDSGGNEVANVNPIVDGSGDIASGTITAACPSCISPNSLGVTGIAADSATLEWTDGNAPSAGFEYEIVDITAGGTQTMTGIAEADTSVTVSGLIGNGNQYQFYVRADCGASIFSDWAGPFAWFQGTPPGTDCANAIVATPGVFNDVAVIDINPGINNGDAIWYSFTPAEDGTMGISSCISDPTGVDTRVFVYTDSCAALISVDNDDDGCSPPNGLASLLEDIPVSGGQEYFIEWDDRWDIDPFDWELTFTPTPDCLEPTDLYVNALFFETSAELGWTDPNVPPTGAYEIELVDITAGGTQTMSGIVVGVNPTAFFGLVGGGNQYEFYVRAICGAGEFSDWAGPFAWTQGTPPGDDCANAIVIPPAGMAYTGTTITNGDRIWFSYTPAEDGTINVNSCGGGVDSDLLITSGADCASATYYADNDDSCPMFPGGNAYASEIDNLAVVTGTTYYIQWLNTYSSSSNPFDWELTFTPTISCFEPTDLYANAFLENSAELGWTDPNVPPTGAYEVEVVDITAGGTQTMSGIVIGVNPTGVSGLVGGGNQYEFYVRAICGAGEFSDWAGPFAWTQGTPPGDDCANAIVIPPAGMAYTGTTITNGDRIWFSYTPAEDGTINVNSCGGGVDSDLLITSGADCASATYYADNDDSCPMFPGGNAYASEIDNLAVVTGTTYYIQWLDTYSSSSNPFDWELTFTLPAVEIVGGVDCASAVAVVEGSYSSQVAGDGSTNTGDEAWFVFTATTGGTLTVDSCFGGADTRLSIFDSCGDVAPFAEGPNGSDDVCDLGNGSFWASSLDYDVLAGQDYVIRWDDRWSDGVLFDWNVSFTPSCPGITTTWDGSSWDNGVPGTNDYAIIAGFYFLPFTSLDVCSLQIDATAILSSGEFIRTDGDISITSSGILEVLPQASVVQVDNTATAKNDGIIFVKTETPFLEGQSFMISGTPMTGETREGVYGDSYIVRNHVTANFVPNPDVEVLAAGLNNWADNDGNNWLNHTGGLNPGEGYMVFPQLNSSTIGLVSYTQTHTLGTLNNGVINFNMGYNGMQSNSPNMMANPYASAIDAELFFDDPANADINEVYFWEHLTPLSTAYPGYNVANFNMGDISIYSESLGGVQAANGGATPTQVISTGQGFGVKPLAGGIAEFNNAMRITGPNNTYRSSTVNRDRIWMNVYNDTYGLGSTALIGFTENNEDGYNKSEDIDRLPTPVSLYSELETGEELVVNALGSFETNDAFYLSFSTQVKETQEYRISIQNMDGVNFENTTVYLIDSLTGTVTNLTEGDYTFESWEAVYSKRFKVVFENSALGINGLNLDSVTLYPNPTQNIVTIVSPNVMLISATVHDIRGRMISVIDFTNQSTYRVDLSTMEVGVYFIDINTENGTVTKRVIKQE